MGISADTEGWSTWLVRSIADEVRRRRTELGWSAQKLSDECAALGFDFPRSTLSDLESGRRKQVSVPELIALAAALHVPPLLLIYPVGRKAETEMLPGAARPAFRAAEWFSGTAFLPGPDDAGTVTKIPAEQAWPGQALVLYREHDRAFSAEMEAMSSAGDLDMAAAATGQLADQFATGARAARQLAAGFRQAQAALRDQAGALGILPPDEPTAWLLPADDEKPEAG